MAEIFVSVSEKRLRRRRTIWANQRRRRPRRRGPLTAFRRRNRG